MTPATWAALPVRSQALYLSRVTDVRMDMTSALERVARPKLVVHVGVTRLGHAGCVIERDGERVPFVFAELIQQFGPLR